VTRTSGCASFAYSAKESSLSFVISKSRIHIDLPGSFGREFGGFQLDQHIGVQNLVVEHHVHIIVGVIHSDPLLRADKHKAPDQVLTGNPQSAAPMPLQGRSQGTAFPPANLKIQTHTGL